jgi:hypothetical protein
MTEIARMEMQSCLVRGRKYLFAAFEDIDGELLSDTVVPVRVRPPISFRSPCGIYLALPLKWKNLTGGMVRVRLTIRNSKSQSELPTYTVGEWDVEPLGEIRAPSETEMVDDE